MTTTGTGDITLIITLPGACAIIKQVVVTWWILSFLPSEPSQLAKHLPSTTVYLPFATVHKKIQNSIGLIH